MLNNCRFVYQLTEENILNLMEMYKKESWSKDRQLEDVKKMLDKSWIIAILDSKNSSVIAFARVLTDFVYRAFIYDVIVSENYRGLGYGKLIVNSILNHADLQHVERIELTCIDSNIPFYEKLGFKKVPSGSNLMRYYDTIVQ